MAIVRDTDANWVDLVSIWIERNKFELQIGALITAKPATVCCAAISPCDWQWERKGNSGRSLIRTHSQTALLMRESLLIDLQLNFVFNTTAQQQRQAREFWQELKNAMNKNFKSNQLGIKLNGKKNGD